MGCQNIARDTEMKTWEREEKKSKEMHFYIYKIKDQQQVNV